MLKGGGITGNEAAAMMLAETGSLKIDQSILIHNINHWYNLGKQKAVFDGFATYLIKAFTTLITKHRSDLSLSGNDVITIMDHIKTHVGKSLKKLYDLRETGSYTDFCRTLFGEGTTNADKIK